MEGTVYNSIGVTCDDVIFMKEKIVNMLQLCDSLERDLKKSNQNCKMIVEAEFKYKTLWLNSFQQKTANEEYKVYEVGFMFEDERQAELRFRVLNNKNVVNLKIKQNEYGDICFSSLEDIDIFV